jgi:hypothetical protein
MRGSVMFRETFDHQLERSGIIDALRLSGQKPAALYYVYDMKPPHTLDICLLIQLMSLKSRSCRSWLVWDFNIA